MRIALAEIRGEKKLGTREFEQTEVKIGREKDRCDLVFDRAQWPMVSRAHAALNIEGGRCYLTRSEEHTSELQSRQYLVCRLLLEKKKIEVLKSAKPSPQHR